MKLPPVPHSWKLSPRQAIAVQREMASRVSQSPPGCVVNLIAGLDAAFSPDGRQCLSAVVLWDMRLRKVVEQHTARRPLTFPYIPGLLSFREIPALLAALRKLEQRPDALMCDGQGLAHPRRFGIACHLGVICNLPALGCAKSRLIGTHEEPAQQRSSCAALEDKGQVIGSVLRTQTSVKPVFVSIGHRMDLATAERIVLDCAIRYRLPEPTRLADRSVAAVKRAMSSTGRYPLT